MQKGHNNKQPNYRYVAVDTLREDRKENQRPEMIYN